MVVPQTVHLLLNRQARQLNLLLLISSALRMPLQSTPAVLRNLHNIIHRTPLQIEPHPTVVLSIQVLPTSSLILGLHH